ncbi:MAG TPA: prenyltransferase/squalene oxidase repeat-containing protein [Gemmataceae bacterium]|jgi:prenyltransferase beta subunit|nr:prenyltransferase/squalene oxidase repeat-containing protein [Gemmataceae bacterium]
MRFATLFALLLSLPLFGQTPGEKKQTLEFLASLQRPDGGFIAAPIDPKSSKPAPVSSLRATSAAVRAIKYFGGRVPSKDEALAFVKSCYLSESGAFSDTPGGTPDVSVTAIGMMASAELQKDPRLDKSVAFLVKNAKTFEERRLAVAGMEAAKMFDPIIKEWFAEITKSANKDGTFGKDDGRARDSGGTAAMLLRAGEKLYDEQRKSIVAVLKSSQRTDGGFGKAGEKTSDGETTYRVMRAFYLLKEKPGDVEKLRDFIGKCRNADGGYGVAPGQPSSVSGTYYAAVILHWLKS